ncbi:NIF family HAD-type phosphatase [Ferruginibacter sp.]
MKFFNLFKPNAAAKPDQLNDQPAENNPGHPPIEKEKITYSSDTTLTDVLNYIRNNTVQLGIQLNNPATDTEIEAFEAQITRLPEDFKMLYRFSNGFETDQDLFRLIPLAEIAENDLDKDYLVNDSSFHFTEYMIYSDMWSVDTNKEETNKYSIYNKTNTVVYLTNSLAEFLCVFINKGIYDGLYGWIETKERSGRLLVLDLDETLIHAAEKESGVPADFQFDKYFVYKRPHLDKFLTDISKHYTLGIWSSADDKYVTEIVNKIKPDNITFEIIWGRSRCTLKHNRTYDNYYFEKKLDKLKRKGFKLEQIIIVYDTPEKSTSNYGNAVYIKEFTGDTADEELMHLYDYLLILKNADNVRTIEKRGWRENKSGS